MAGKTSYPKKGSKRTGTSYDEGKTYKAPPKKKSKPKPKPSDLGSGMAKKAGDKLKGRKKDIDDKLKKAGA